MNTSRRKFLQASAGAATVAALSGFSGGAAGASGKTAEEAVLNLSASLPEKPNFLFVTIDDQNDWVSPFGGYAGAHTPNWERLAASSTTYMNAFCNAPLCNASRASLMYGLYPWTSGIKTNDDPTHAILRGYPTIPEYLAQNSGYYTAGVGKLFHRRRQSAWIHRFPPRPKKNVLDAPVGNADECYQENVENGQNGFDWGVDEIPRDVYTVDQGVDFLTNPPTEDPWFLGVGIFRPHLSWYVPQEYFDLYPLESVQIPEVAEDILADMPEVPRKDWVEYRLFQHECLVKYDLWRDAVRAYLAATSFADAQLGRLLDAVPEDTVVIVTSDHGFHLGEKLHWQKATLWDTATRVPLCIRIPGMEPAVVNAPVSLIDLYPTITELANAPANSLNEGTSIVSTLGNSEANTKPAVMGYMDNNYAVRSRNYRYIRYRNGEEELYDFREDPREWNNIADHPAMLRLKTKLAKHMPTFRARKPEWRPPAR